MKHNRIIKTIFYAIVLITVVIYLYPLLYVVNVSLKTSDEFIRTPLSIAKSFELQNYASAWQKANFGTYIFNSILYTAVCTLTSLLITVLIAFPIARKYIKSHKIIYKMFLIGMFLPGGGITVFQMILNLHLYNTRFGYMITMIGTGGVSLFFFINYINSIPKDFDEAAAIDGCGYFKFIFTILIPLIKPAIASMGILGAIGIWNDIIGASIYLSDNAKYPIVKGLFAFVGQYNNNWTEMTAATAIVATPLILLYIALQKYIVDGAVAGAVKQ